MAVAVKEMDVGFEGEPKPAVQVDNEGQSYVDYGDMRFYFSPPDPLAVPGFLAATLRSPWPDGIIPLQFGPGITGTMKATLLQACALWDDVGVRFVERTTEGRFASVQDAPYDVTSVGYMSGVNRPKMLLSSLNDLPTLTHEVGHLLGLEHEHQRSDRDDWITLDKTNITKAGMSQFSKTQNTGNITTYDFDSIMHYPQYSSRDAVRPADPLFFVKQGTPNGAIGGKARPSPKDIAGLQSFYQLA